jgi:hypothetical protein
MKLGQGMDGLRGFDIGSWHPEKMAATPSNVLWRLRHNTGTFGTGARFNYIFTLDMNPTVNGCA